MQVSNRTRTSAVLLAVPVIMALTAVGAGAEDGSDPLQLRNRLSGLVPMGPPPAAPPPAPAAPAPAPGGTGAVGGILELEQRLEALRFDPGPVDGVFDQDTRYAVTAFQKVNDMPRTGEATPDVMSAVGSYSGPPAPLAPGGGSNRVEIDLRRQVLFLYQGDTLAKILPISSGNGKRFCSGGSCRKAITPTGRFAVYQQRRGWETSPLGRLYNSQYFVGGYAIHGSHSVPPEPASHGCVRIPMRAAEWFPSQVTIGTPVHVLG